MKEIRKNKFVSKELEFPKILVVKSIPCNIEMRNYH